MRLRTTAVLSVLCAFTLIGSVGCDTAGCDILQPMPNGNAVPASQTIEGGIQLRVTPSGFDKISAVIPSLLEGLGDITVIDENTTNFAGLIDFTLCPGGCNLSVEIPTGGVTVRSNGQRLIVDIALLIDFSLDFRICDATILNLGCFSCGVRVAALRDPLTVTAEIEPYIRDSDGEMRIRLVGLSNLSLGSLAFTASEACPGLAGDLLDNLLSVLTDAIQWIDGLLGNVITEFIINNFLLPQMQGVVDGLLPDPLGVEGQFDIGSLLADFSPRTKGAVELRLTPGGYVNLLGNGMSLGVITGVNSDSDPATRGSTITDGVALHSEPAACMPAMPTMDLSTVNGGLQRHSVRQTYMMGAVDELSGLNDTGNLQYTDPNSPLVGQTADLAIGVSEAFLDLFGFHLANSGSLCMEIGTAEVDLLKVGLFSILVSSLTNLVDPEVGDAPMRLVIRPQNPVEFTIGTGTSDDPLIDLFLKDFQIDVYVFSEGRYTRAFTMALDMHVGINLSSYVDSTDGTVYLTPTLESINAANVSVRILNSELIEDKPAQLETLLPNVLGMIVPMLTSALQDIALPEFQGIKLENIEFRSNNARNMMLILASLATPNPPPPGPLPPPPPAVRTEMDVARVHVPSPEDLRASLLDPSVPKAYKNVPEVTLNLTSRLAELGENVEWQYRIDNGLWRGFRRDQQRVIRDPALIFQGWHKIEVRGRVAGKMHTLEREPVSRWVLIDSTAPLLKPKADGNRLLFNGYDFVSARNHLRYAYEIRPGEFSSWSPRGTMDLGYAQRLAAKLGGQVRVRARDEAGNVGEAVVTTQMLGVHAVTEEKGGCSTAQSDSGLPFGLLLVLGVLGIFGVRRRRAVALPFVLVAIVAAAALVAGGCAKKAGSGNTNNVITCNNDDDCSALQCPRGELPLCMPDGCRCMDDVPWGKIGPHTSLAVNSSEALVAAYNVRYGDLMLGRLDLSNIPSRGIVDRWEFVDGVPFGIDPDVPTSDIRGGITRAGDDVGRFTSIKANLAGNPIIAYYSKTNGALKLARHDGSQWNIHIVDDGGNPSGVEGGDAGRYAKLTLASDEAPGVAYLVRDLLGDQDNTKAQLRFAQANTPTPTSGSDWTVHTVDEVNVPIPAPDAPLADYPGGVGVTISVARTSDGRPVIAYYDSINGNLKVAEYIDATTGFAAPTVLDGHDAVIGDTGNVGLFSSIQIDPSDDTLWHVTYVDADFKILYYINTADMVPETVDDGLRMETNPISGLDSPVSHFVGFDSQLGVAGGLTWVSYQDATDHSFNWAERDDTTGEWTIQTIKGDVEPTMNPDGSLTYEGAYGFYLSQAVSGAKAYVASYAVNEWAVSDLLGNPPDVYYVEIFEFSLGPQ